MSTRIHVVVDEGLLARVDGVRGDVPRSRWIVRAMERALSGPPSPPTEMLDREHLQKTGRARLLPLDPSAPSVDAAMMPAQREAASVRPASEVRYVCRHGDFRAASPKARCPRHGGALVPEGS